MGDSRLVVQFLIPEASGVRSPCTGNLLRGSDGETFATERMLCESCSTAKNLDVSRLYTVASTGGEGMHGLPRPQPASRLRCGSHCSGFHDFWGVSRLDSMCVLGG